MSTEPITREMLIDMIANDIDDLKSLVTSVVYDLPQFDAEGNEKKISSSGFYELLFDVILEKFPELDLPIHHELEKRDDEVFNYKFETINISYDSKTETYTYKLNYREYWKCQWGSCDRTTEFEDTFHSQTREFTFRQWVVSCEDLVYGIVQALG